MQTIVRIKVLSNSMSSEQMTTMIGVVPERSWNIGDVRPKTQFKETTNGIIIDSGVAWNSPIEKHFEAIVAKVIPIHDRFLAVSDNCTILLSIVYYSDYNPGLWFDSSFIKFLSEIKAGIDVDGYVLDAETVELIKPDK